MCDPDGLFIFKDGNRYKGSLKTCSKICINKFGSFDGQGKLILKDLGEFTGTFHDSKVDGKGTFEDLKGKIRVEDTWKNVSIDELVKDLQKRLQEWYEVITVIN